MSDTKPEQLQEVKPLREIVVDSTCCGKSMMKMVSPSGNPQIRYACLKCGTQKVGPKP